jgi:Raf kinase inhibitor-like YbhB/YbcL family protein
LADTWNRTSEEKLMSNVHRVVYLSRWVALFFACATTQIGCNRDVVVPQGAPSLELKSASLMDGAIPKKYSSCAGESSVSPALSWSAPPAGTRDFALIAIDRDSPMGFKFVHWVLYDLPPGTRELPEGIAKQAQLPDGSRQGQNGDDHVGYVGPCPPGHSAHRYVFDVYALDTKLNLPAGASRKDVVKAIDGHVLASGEVVGRFAQ